MLYSPLAQHSHLDPKTVGFYQTAMRALDQAKIPYLVGGSYALTAHTQMPRRTKDLDLFILPRDVPRVLETLAGAGYRTELTFSHWLAKAWNGDDFIDIIFNSGNGLCQVDQLWFEYGLDGMVLDQEVKLCPLEESIWQKSFIMERHRYDGADVAHLLRAGGEDFDWPRLLWRFGDHWEVLFSHVLLFGFIYPAESRLVPAWVRDELTQRYRERAKQTPKINGHRCGGTFLSSVQYRDDVEEGMRDARLRPEGKMSAQELADWMASFDE